MRNRNASQKLSVVVRLASSRHLQRRRVQEPEVRLKVFLKHHQCNCYYNNYIGADSAERILFKIKF
jgi:hypothetical protein